MRHLKSQKGIALPLVLLIIIVLILLGFALSVFGYYEATSAIREEHLAKAYYSARGSVAALAKYLAVVPADEAAEQEIANYVTTIATTDKYATGSIEGVPYRIVATRVNDFTNLTGVLTLTSTGTSGQYSKSASVEIGYSLKEYMNMGPFGIVDSALYAEVKADSGGSITDYKAKAYGKVKTNNTDLSKIEVTVKLEPAPYDKPVYEPQPHPLPNEPAFPTTDNDGVVIPSRSSFVTDVEATGVTPIADGSFYSGSITTSNSPAYDAYNDRAYNLNGFPTEIGTPTYISIQNLNIKNNLLFNNNGPVYIWVTNSLDISAKVGCSPKCGYVNKVYKHDDECWLGRVNIIFTGTNPIRITGNPYIRANIIALNAQIIQPDKDADFYIGGNVTMSGHVICGGDLIELYGSFSNNPSMIYAPKAKVFIGGSAFTHYGAIVCDTFEANANATLNYQAILRQSLPLWFDAEDSGGFLGDTYQVGSGEYYAKNLQFTRWID